MISGKNKDLYYTSSIDKQLNIEVVGTKIVIDNSMRERDTFALTETLNDGTELKFGSCLPNQISFTAYDMSAGLVGEILRPVETLEGNEDDPFTYGKYKILSAAPTADRTKRQVTAYDAMYDIINADVKAWYDGLTFPMTLKAFRDSFFKHLDIEQEDTTLVNDSMTVNKTLVASSSEDSAVTAESTISGKTIIEAICEINGAFGNMNRAGKFEYVILPTIVSALYPSDTLYPSDDLFPSDSNAESMSGHYITFDYEDFQSQAITQLEIRADDNTAGAIVGNAGNTYVISGNFLVSDKTGAELEQIANNVLPIMAQASYTPIKSCTTVGNPCLELGDPIRFNTSREIVETYILQRTLTGVQSKRDSIVAQGTETHTAKVNSIRDTLESVQRRTSKLERNADHLLSQYEDLEEQTSSKIEQTADAITAEVKRAQKAEGALDASLELKLGRDENDQVVSMLNASADVINLKGNRLVVESSNFKLDASGNAEFSGDINGAKGSFTKGFSVELPEADYGALVAQFLIKTTADGVFIGLRPNTSGTYGFRIKNGKIYLTGVATSTADDPNHLVYINGKKAATLSDIPDTSGFATVNSSGFVSKASYATEASYVANTASSSHTANMYSASDNKMYYCPQGSSRRFKTDIESVKDENLDPHRLYDVDVVQFKYKPSFYGLPDDTPMDTVIGFIAEDIKDKYPCATEYDETTGEVNNWLERYIVPPMLALIQEQHEEIETLKKRNEDFERRLSALEGK